MRSVGGGTGAASQLPAGACRPHLLELRFQDVQFHIAEFLDVDHMVASLVDGVDEFVELEINGPGIAILGVLDKKDHKEGNDGSAGIDNKLPGIGEVKDRPRNPPGGDEKARADEGPF